MKKSLLSLIAVISLTFAVLPAEGGYFGKNKVRYNDLDWQVLETAHFEIYYYVDELELALETVPLAEAIYNELSDRLGHQMGASIPLVLYGSHPEFQRTNIAGGWIDEGTGGITEFLKRRVFLPYPGSREDFRHVLQHELAHAFQIDILAPDGSMERLGEISIPLWMIEGMAEYLSVGAEDPFTLMWLRDALLDGPPPSFRSLARGRDVRIYRFGQSAWAYLARLYGEETPGDFLRSVGASGDAEEAMREIFGKSSQELSDEWHDFLRQEHYPRLADLDRKTPGTQRVLSHGRVNVSPAVSAAGDKLAFLSDRSGSLSLYLADGDGNEVERIVEGESWRGVESMRAFYGAPQWSPDGRHLLFPAQRHGEDMLFLYDLRNSKVVRQLSIGMEEMRGITWSPSGEEVVVAGVRNGRTNLYRVTLEKGEVEALTDDRFTYMHPDWSPDGRRIVCATDRVDAGRPGMMERDLQLAFYDLTTGSWEILKGQAGSNHSPVWSGDGERIAFVSNRYQTLDLYQYEIDKGTTRRLTSLQGGISGLIATSPALSWSRETGSIYYSYFREQSWSIYRMDNVDSTMGKEVNVKLASLEIPSLIVEQNVSAEIAPPPAEITPYKIRPYRPQLSVDLASGGGGAASEGGIYSGSAVSLSDILGNHRLRLMLGIYGSFQSSDFYVGYTNLSRRTAYEAALFQFTRQGSDLIGGGRTSRTVYRGASFQVSRPLDRYRRLELGVRAGEANQFDSEKTIDFAGLYGAWVLDQVRWSYSGARGGERIRLSVEPIVSPGFGGWVLGDFRFYRPLGDRITFASRSIGGSLFGSRVPAFRVAPRFVIRGFYDNSWEEERYAAQSFELRFPLVDYLKLGWPLPLELGGIRGALFADAGYFPNDLGASEERYSLGAGIRSGFGPFQLMLDFPQKFDSNGKVGKMSGFFQLGQEF